jgi:ATPase components of various ABC-type transport systems, contain duplicated ATPase
MAGDDYILEVRDLKKHFVMSRGYTVKAVDGIAFKVRRGETYGLVGESGSGKSTAGRTIIRLEDPTSGELRFEGKDIGGKLTRDELAGLRTGMQMIFQDPMSCLNPRKKVLDIVGLGLDVNGLYSSKREREEKVYAMLERVGLSREHATRYPHQFSGGQRQRIGIARALIVRPRLVIADECISALDVSIQAQVVNLMQDLQAEFGITYLFIAHDLSMVKYISDHIGVMHKGHIVESGTKEEIFAHPVHPYTKSLLSAIPEPNPIAVRNRASIPYDAAGMGIDYAKGAPHSLSETHEVIATDEEFKAWAD